MKTKQERVQAVVAVLRDAIKPEGTGWPDIMGAVKAAGIPVKNWLTEVRGPLQWLADRSEITRLDVPGDKVYSTETWGAMTSLRTAVLAARERTGDATIGTRAQAGSIQIIRVTYSHAGTSTVEPLSHYLPPDAAIRALGELQLPK